MDLDFWDCFGREKTITEKIRCTQTGDLSVTLWLRLGTISYEAIETGKLSGISDTQGYCLIHLMNFENIKLEFPFSFLENLKE